MYLKSLVLIGFKSFAHKTVIDFHRGVTAIVGPNGCGKSNILDSIRWVLGEQSAKALRGDEMADVIFSGTDSKLAVGMAEVSLTFADCEKDLGTDYNEVSVTRRVFRDGSSNYLLNNLVCRLKDIQMLFMDTGVGRLAYSIMEQGKIDMILSSRPEDRRVIFEEAAGITKYKTQKREALRKLEFTDANLIRLTDITREVKRQIGSLHRQAAKARRYKALFKNLRTLDIHLCHRFYEDFKGSIAVLHDEIGKLIESQKSIEQQIESEESSLCRYRSQLEKLDAAIDVVHRRIREHQNQVDHAATRIELNQERIQEASYSVRRSEEDLASSEEKLGIQQSHLQKTDELLVQISRGLEAEQAQLSVWQTETSALKDKRQKAEHLLLVIHQAIQQKETRIATLKGEISGLCNQRESGKARLQLVEKEIIQSGAAKRDLKIHTENIHLEFEKAQTGLQSIRDNLIDSEHLLLTREQEISELQGELSSNQRTLSERESRLEVLKLLNEEGAGLGAGSQAILKGLSDPQIPRATILGAFANYIEVNNESVVAIEAVLSQHLQAVVITDLAAAELIISQVSERKLGRAAVLPMSFLPENQLVQTESLPEQAEAWALDQILCQPEVASLVTQLLKNVVIAKDISSAIAIKNQFSDLAIATLNGDLVSHEGVVFAGTGTEKGNSILQRKLQIKQLQSESEKIRSLIENLDKGHEKLKAELEL
ncbi:MAG: chromosome segregation protein SMC, partial [Verrucomicrobia bacterium]|nr:chromosome segregation protein SMC [Verrucomicrobiota bacterium]